MRAPGPRRSPDEVLGPSYAELHDGARMIYALMHGDAVGHGDPAQISVEGGEARAAALAASHREGPSGLFSRLQRAAAEAIEEVKERNVGAEKPTKVGAISGAVSASIREVVL